MSYVPVDDWLDRCAQDPELARYAAGLGVTLLIETSNGARHVTLDDPISLAGSKPSLRIRAEDIAWAQLMDGPHPPGWQSFGAIRRFNSAFSIESENPLIEAQALAALERMVEIAVAPPAAPDRPVDWTPDAIESAFSQHAVDAEVPARIHTLSSGTGPPVLFLHTAGADARQFLYQLGDPALSSSYRLLAFDLPGHGGSSLEGEFSGTARRWQATNGHYIAWCRTMIEALCPEPPIVIGCSAGAAMALTLAAHHPELVRGAIALEAPYRAQGRRTVYLDHPCVSEGRHNQAWVRALMAPGSPKPHRDEACAIYEQARPGLYSEDLRYYVDEFDAGSLVEQLDRNGRPIVLCAGAYDYSATPEDAMRIGDAVRGSVVQTMSNLGHFPMIENPGAFSSYLYRALSIVEDGR